MENELNNDNSIAENNSENSMDEINEKDREIESLKKEQKDLRSEIERLKALNLQYANNSVNKPIKSFDQNIADMFGLKKKEGN